jgi:hypothetical protein
VSSAGRCSTPSRRRARSRHRLDGFDLCPQLLYAREIACQHVIERRELGVRQPAIHCKAA